MVIGIYESEHFETLYPVVRVLDQPGNQLILFTGQSVAIQLKAQLGTDTDRFQWVIKSENQSQRSFINEIGNRCRLLSVEVLLLNTVSNNFIFFATMARKLPGTRSFLTIHDVNNFFRSKTGFTLRKAVRHIGKKMLLENCEGYFTISSRTRDYLASLVKDAKKVYWFPGAVFEEESYQPPAFGTSTRLQIVIPGSLDNRRRNYQEVFELVEICQQKSLPVDFYLLGGVTQNHNRKLLEQCRELKKTHASLYFYELEEVPHNEFSLQMERSHFIWVPSVVNTIMADGIPETYGVSKSSGNLFDAIRYARPLLVPGALSIDTEQEPAAFIYHSANELYLFLENVIKHPDEYDNWKKKALEVARNYSPSTIRNKLANLF